MGKAHLKHMKILIVGAGPTGLTLALTLAKRGIPFRIIEKNKHPIKTSNALAIMPRTLEVWEELGIIHEALKRGHKIQGLSISTHPGEIGKLTFSNLPTKYPFILSLPQTETEELLTESLLEHGVTIDCGVELESLTQTKNCVTVVCNDHAETYDWVIGCDGAHSTVREYLKIPFEGKDLPQHFIMADLEIQWLKSPNFAHAFLSNQGPIAFFPLNDQGFGRLIIDVTGIDKWKSQKPTLEDFQNYLDLRTSVDAKITKTSWISSFWIQARIAKTYRLGRIFLAGDAAHRHSPIGGQGLNTGVLDAFYLANLFGTGTDVDQYEKTRKAIGKKIVERTTMMTKIITSRIGLFQLARDLILKTILRSERLKNKIAFILSQLRDSSKR